MLRLLRYIFSAHCRKPGNQPITCPRCHQPLSGAHPEPYCIPCHTTYQTKEELFDMLEGSFSYTLTGKSSWGIPT